MAKKRISFNALDSQSVNEAIKELDQYINDFNSKFQEFMESLSEKGVVIAKARIVTLDAVFTGDLLKSIHYEKRNGGVFVIKTDNEHAAFVEFGTGQMGEEGPYPYPFPEGVSWDYNSGSTIFEIEDGQYGWFYPTEDGWRFTQGMPSRPFMYEASLDLESIINETAKEVFGK